MRFAGAAAVLVAATTAGVVVTSGEATAAVSSDITVTQKITGSATSGHAIETITVKNVGTAAAANVELVRYLSTSSNVYTSTTSTGICQLQPPPSTAYQIISTCALGTINAGSSKTQVFDLGGTPGVAFTATVTVGSSANDPTFANNKHTVTSYYGPRANLVVSQTAATGTTAGKAIATTTTKNEGPNSASALQLVAEIKTSAGGVGAAATSSSPSASCQAIPPAAGYTAAFSCVTSSLGSGSTWTIHFTYTGTAGATLTVKTTVTATTPTDPVTSNNTKTSVTTFHS